MCGQERPDSECDSWCRGRTDKFAWEPDAKSVLEYRAVRICQGSCECWTCTGGFKEYRLNWWDERDSNFRLPFCKAKRGFWRQRQGLRKYRCVDEEICRSCFACKFFGFRPLHVQLGQQRYFVVWRASEHNWRETLSTRHINKPHHYIHSLEEGGERSRNEMACLHIARHWACHAPGRPCEMLSTTVLITEALRRLSPDRQLQAILVPTRSWDIIACDFSTLANITAIPDFHRHCERHKMAPDTIFEHGLLYREIVLDKRVLRKCNDDIHCILIPPREADLMKERTAAADELKHYFGHSWLSVEDRLRQSFLNTTNLIDCNTITFEC